MTENQMEAKYVMYQRVLGFVGATICIIVGIILSVDIWLPDSFWLSMVMDTPAERTVRFICLGLVILAFGLYVLYKYITCLRRRNAKRMAQQMFRAGNRIKVISRTVKASPALVREWTKEVQQMTVPRTRERSKNQERVNKIVAQNARGMLFINLPEIDLSRVKTSSLYLFYKAVSDNTLAILDAQNAIAEELSQRTKHHGMWSSDNAQSLLDKAQRLHTESSEILNEIKTEQARRAEKKRKRGKRPKLPDTNDFNEEVENK